MTLAHLGGIPELAAFLIPAALAIWALRWAEKRARRRQQENESAE